MLCPIDGTQLVMTERQGVEIDYCPQCRGVWLDRGELDKIVERSAPAAVPPPPPPPAASRRPDDRGFDDRGGYDRGGDDRGYDDRGIRRKKRGGFLEELFDF
ncbi:zf-TFIIB domain-containing protein [Palleronia sp. KMU-117]|uniref:TFIIB-type zinc ribbon-containing protein n=1 Tax=Palleronia sp. KMU-117 TaxID=3434108 RepID=UPI003D73D7CB